MKKIYVLDTNVLLQDPNAVFAFEDNEVVIPAVVLEEIDSKKRNADELGRNARFTSRMLDGLRLQGRIPQSSLTQVHAPQCRFLHLHCHKHRFVTNCHIHSFLLSLVE